MSEAQQLLARVEQQIWTLLRNLRDELRNAASLGGLGAVPGLAGTPLDGKLLQSLDNLSLANPAAASAFALLRSLAAPANAAGLALRLHGWIEAPGAPRSVALCMSGDGSADRLVCALASDTAGEVGVHVIAMFAPALATSAPQSGAGLTFTVRPSAAGVFEAWFGPQGMIDLAPAGACAIECRITRDGGGPIVIGLADAPRMVAQRLAVTPRVQFAPGVAPALDVGIELGDVALDVAPAWLSSIVGSTVRPSLQSLRIQADAKSGLQLGSGGTRVQLPATSNFGPVSVEGVGVELASDGAAAGLLHLRIGLDLRADPPGLPLAIDVSGAGAAFPLRIGAGDAFGFDPADIVGVPARGIAADLTLPMASGGGALIQLSEHEFGGAFDLNLGFVAVQAFAVLQSVPGESFSFIALMSVRFPMPGIQLGFGFSLNGVGGIVGINRRLNANAMEAAVLDGSVNRLLFPTDPARNSTQAIATLSQVFPAENGHFVVGPMLELGWGGRIVTLVVALVFDLPDPPQFAVLGRLTIALPDPALPAVFIQATFLGQFDPSIPSTRFVGTLCGSHIVGMPLRGDVMMLARGGNDATFVVSAGGFHPAFVRPPDVPALRRIGVELSPLPFPRLRAEMYFAFTAGSVQFGASVQISYTILGCGVEGWFGIDALCQWSPVFSFVASCGASVAVEVFGETLLAVSLSLEISGPTPWRVSGTGTVTLFIKDLSLDFETSWGDEPATQIAAPNVEEELRNAFRDSAAWVAELPTRDRGVAILGDTRRAAGAYLHPASGVVARQRVLPFDITIARYQGVPVAAQRWRLAGGGLRAGDDAPLGAPVVDLFPMAQYLDLSDDEQLGGRAFDPMNCGVGLLPDEYVTGPRQDGGEDFETNLVVENQGSLFPFLGVLAVALDAASRSLASQDAHAERSWWTPAVATGLVVQAAQPVALAAADSLTASPLASAGVAASYSAAREFAGGAFAPARKSAQLVERWELA